MMPLDSCILEQASCRASLLVATAGFRSDDWDDLRQEMVLDCLRRSSKFDPARGEWPVFVRGITWNQATVLIRRKHRRAKWETLAEDVFASQLEQGHTLDDVLPAGSGDLVDDLHLRLDVARILGSLPPQLRLLARLLSIMPVCDVCVSMGKSRSRIYQMTGEVREAFVRAGLGPADRRNHRRLRRSARQKGEERCK